MPRFDIPGRTEPAHTTLHPGGRERVFVLPYDTENPGDIKLLRKHPLLEESEVPPAPVATFKVVNEAADLTPEEATEAAEKYQIVNPRKPSRKEVD